MVKNSIESIAGVIEKEHEEYLKLLETAENKSDTILKEINKLSPDEKSKLMAKLLSDNENDDTGDSGDSATDTGGTGTNEHDTTKGENN